METVPPSGFTAHGCRANLLIKMNLLRAIGSERLAIWQAVLRSCPSAFSGIPDRWGYSAARSFGGGGGHSELC